MLGLSVVHIGLFLVTISVAAADPICSSIFGQPSFNDCEELGVQLLDSWPGDKPQPSSDRYTHFFSVPGAEIPFWVSRRPSLRRVDLPKFASHSKLRHHKQNVL